MKYVSLIASASVACGIILAYTSAEAAGCTAATIAGNFAAHGEGFTGTAAPFTPAAFVATRTFDGVGAFTGVGYQSEGGVIVRFSTSGTYTVHPDCTILIEGSISSAHANRQFGVISSNGTEIFTTRIDAGETIGITYTKVSP